MEVGTSRLPSSQRKRFIITDTCGFLIFIPVYAASINNRHGAPDVLKVIRFRLRGLQHVFADDGHAGNKLMDALKRVWQLDTRNHQVLGHRQRLRDLVKQMGRRTHISMAGPVPPPGPGLGVTHCKFTEWATIARIRMLTR